MLKYCKASVFQWQEKAKRIISGLQMTSQWVSSLDIRRFLGSHTEKRRLRESCGVLMICR